jgi:hypothetical protein
MRTALSSLLILALAASPERLCENDTARRPLQERDERCETAFDVKKVTLKEAEGSDLPDGVLMRVEGVLGQVDEVNRNGRIYPRKLMQREAKEAKKRLEARDMFVLEDHPTWSEPMGGSAGKIAGIQAEIRLGDAKDNNIYGSIDIIDTTSGRNVYAIVKAGGKIGISQRGYGTAIEDEYETVDGKRVVARVVQDDYKLEGFDIVIGPSARANVTGFKESEGDDMKVTLAVLRLPENKDVLDAILAEGKALGIQEGKAQGVTEGKAAGIQEATANVATKVEEAKREFETAHATGIALERHFAAQEEHKADPLARVRALEATEADAKQAALIRKTIGEKAGANPAVAVEAEKLAFDPETGKARMTVEALTGVIESLLKGRTTPTPGSHPPRGAGHHENGEPTPGTPEAEAAFKKRLESVNAMRRSAGQAPYTEAQLRALDGDAPAPSPAT